MLAAFPYPVPEDEPMTEEEYELEFGTGDEEEKSPCAGLIPYPSGPPSHPITPVL